MARPKPEWAPEKQCTKCKEIKLLEDFSPNKNGVHGRASNCKKCGAAYTRKYYYSKPGASKKAQERFKEWREKNRGKYRAAKLKNYYKHPHKTHASVAVNRAIRSGLMKRLSCAICGEAQTEAHHFSYEKQHWLDVVFLCTEHHEEAHAGLLPQIKIPGEQPPPTADGK